MLMSISKAVYAWHSVYEIKDMRYHDSAYRAATGLLLY